LFAIFDLDCLYLDPTLGFVCNSYPLFGAEGFVSFLNVGYELFDVVAGLPVVQDFPMLYVWIIQCWCIFSGSSSEAYYDLCVSVVLGSVDSAVWVCGCYCEVSS
jgi:hypothetical protein